MANVLDRANHPSRFVRNRHRRRRLLDLIAPHLGAGLICITAVAWAFAAPDMHETTSSTHAVATLSRRMLYDYEPGICDSYLNTTYPSLAVVMLLWGVFYMFWGLAIVCDDYFVTSLDDISTALSLSPDVAGATFMAAGSSAPELFTSLMGVFAVESDVGIGTIVGSAVFNLCCIIGGTAICTPVPEPKPGETKARGLQIDWMPITRDCIFYTYSICAMIYVIRDGWVDLPESVFLTCSYAGYVVFMASWSPYIKPCIKGNEAERLEDEEEEENKEEEEEAADDGQDSPVLKAIARPLFLLFEISIPNCAEPRNKKRYLVTFFMSIFWIGVLSYFMVTWASKLGCLWGIHPAVMGVTVLAAGTSVPDAIGSLLVARDGQGDMAVSNAIGSNVFDILLGLGLPWALANMFKGKMVHVDIDGLLPLSVLLLVTLLLVYTATFLSGFVLTKGIGVFFFILYFVFVAYSLLHDFGKIPF